MLSVEGTGRSCQRRAGEDLPGRKAKAPGGKKLVRREQSDQEEGGARLLPAWGWGRGLEDRVRSLLYFMWDPVKSLGGL